MKHSKADKPSTSQDKAVELPKGGYNVTFLARGWDFRVLGVLRAAQLGAVWYVSDG